MADGDTAVLDPAELTFRQMLRQSAATLGDSEIRFLVDLYYQMQDHRKATDNQRRANSELGEPSQAIQIVLKETRSFEESLKQALDQWTMDQELGIWVRQTRGIGPVLAAGLMAHIDPRKSPTAGGVWRFAGLDPSMVWEKGQKRPFNLRLKVLCWKIGESFVKQSSENSKYRLLYEERRAYEEKKNEAGDYAEQAADKVKHYRKGTAPRKRLEEGKLPDSLIHARCKRWSVKLFLAHYHQAAYRIVLKEDPPKPYAIEHLGHAHFIEPEVPFPTL